MQEVFLNAEDEAEDTGNNPPDTTPTLSPSSPQHVEFIIHGSPLWLVAGIALFLVMTVSLFSDGSGGGDWSWWFTLVVLVMPVYGFFEYVKTVIVSWDQEQRHVEVFEGVRNSEERWSMLAYTSEPGDQITIESKPVSRSDPLGSRDYWLVVKRKDGTHVASSEDADVDTRYFAKRIKQCLDQLQ